MQSKKIFFTSLCLSAAAGWALGFLRLPYLETTEPLLPGFIACLALVCLGAVALFILHKNSTEQEKRISLRKIKAGSVAGALIVAGVAAGAFTVYLQNKQLRKQARLQHEKIGELTQFIDSTRNRNESLLLSGIMQTADEEIKSNPQQKLSDATIAQIIVAANQSFTPCRYWQGDSLSKNEISLGRGQLLLTLATLHIDSVSFFRIKQAAAFSGAGLSGADLKGLDLSGINLQGADLKDADLSGANLRGANLQEADLQGARMDGANLSGAVLKRANLAWSTLNDARLQAANLDGAQAANAQWRNAALQGATARWATLSGALLNEANCENADFIGAELTRANLSRATLRGANLGKAVLSETILTETEWSNACVDVSDWFEKLRAWRVAGVDEMQEHYLIAGDTTGRYKESKFHLQKK